MSYGETPGILSQDVSRPWGERVKQWRTQRGISPEALAGLLKVSKATVVGWERQVRTPRSEDQYTVVFQQLQVEAGESPGMDTRERVSFLWRTHLRGGK